MNSNKGRWLRMMIPLFIVVITILSTSNMALSDDPTKAHGIWKVVSFIQEVQVTGERRPFFGKIPQAMSFSRPRDDLWRA
jgi:hypothetical protein